ncbi:MAG: hypothetical protein VXZ04_04445 [Candidatus Thermoplasmatota archaeon]|nr:hypothetical protein [Candidatus Thermoplasmatota archaeon]GIR75862.1 MAG: hypothetical protein CM15mP78_05610 [Candidatus Poseidoniales archaeon]MEC7444513.1 hypothetical protein [Candidatus Thermoplasmatota archaeon]MEC7508482.1 hypothetical protein [Candidatus Thermoplasmatota archaeon]MEC7635522.1 hypothetical protein [Candidatus Thermoplasmatota archaeon]
MPGLMEVFILKDRVNGDRDNIFLMLFEKAFILISLLVVLLVAVSLNFPLWGVAVAVGASLGPIVYGHYYIIYIRPVKKQQKIDESKKRGKRKRK